MAACSLRTLNAQNASRNGIVRSRQNDEAHSPQAIHMKLQQMHKASGVFKDRGRGTYHWWNPKAVSFASPNEGGIGAFTRQISVSVRTYINSSLRKMLLLW